MQTIDVRREAKRLGDGVLGSAHEVWLAGLGALALAEEEGRGLFAQLVDRGKRLEERGRDQVGRARDEVGRARERVVRRVDELGGVLDRRVAEAMHRVGIPTREEIAALTRRIEELSARMIAPPAAAATPPKVVRVAWADGQWRVTAEGDGAAPALHATKDEAVVAARELAAGLAPSRVVVEKMDGTVQSETEVQPS
ncbi:MAG TPA: phasin family protein [Thermoanaerobaculia bacterium]|nr:phasin family protein [Thermoanaerobaculia bacterium]